MTAAIGWASEAAGTAFPLQDDTSPFIHSVTGAPHRLPRPGLVDAAFVAGPGLDFDVAVDRVVLSQVARVDASTYTFTFVVGSGPNLSATASAAGAAQVVKLTSGGGTGCRGDWAEGWVTFYDLRPLAAILTADGQAIGGSASVEPALVQSLAGTLVTGLTFANKDRVTVPAVGDVGDPSDRLWRPWEACVAGEIRIAAGYNAAVTVDARKNAITLGAAVGAGEGRPCGEVKTYPGETLPAGSSVYSGGPTCPETIRSVNGLPGPAVAVEAGPGFTVVPDPGTNTVTIRADV